MAESARSWGGVCEPPQGAGMSPQGPSLSPSAHGDRVLAGGLQAWLKHQKTADIHSSHPSPQGATVLPQLGDNLGHPRAQGGLHVLPFKHPLKHGRVGHPQQHISLGICLSLSSLLSATPQGVITDWGKIHPKNLTPSSHFVTTQW